MDPFSLRFANDEMEAAYSVTRFTSSAPPLIAICLAASVAMLPVHSNTLLALEPGAEQRILGLITLLNVFGFAGIAAFRMWLMRMVYQQYARLLFGRVAISVMALFGACAVSLGFLHGFPVLSGAQLGLVTCESASSTSTASCPRCIVSTL